MARVLTLAGPAKRSARPLSAEFHGCLTVSGDNGVDPEAHPGNAPKQASCLHADGAMAAHGVTWATRPHSPNAASTRTRIAACFSTHLGEVASSSQIHDDAAALKAFKQQQIV